MTLLLWQIVAYNSTPKMGHYRAHHDSGQIADGLEPMRVYSVFYQLNDVQRGVNRLPFRFLPSCLAALLPSPASSPGCDPSLQGQTQFPGAFRNTSGWTQDQWDALEWQNHVQNACDPDPEMRKQIQGASLHPIPPIKLHGLTISLQGTPRSPLGSSCLRSEVAP